MYEYAPTRQLRHVISCMTMFFIIHYSLFTGLTYASEYILLSHASFLSFLYHTCTRTSNARLHIYKSCPVLSTLSGTSSSNVMATTLARAVTRPSPTQYHSLFLALPAAARLQTFSVLNRPPPNYPSHVPLSFLERCGLAVGSAIGSMVDHHRHGKTPSNPPTYLSLHTSLPKNLI